MSSLFNHIFIPIVVIVLFSGSLKLDLRKVLAFSTFAILPDADVIFLPHRATFHNAFILIIPVLLYFLMKSKRDVFGIICFYLLSHLILDLFGGGIFFLYPVYNKVIFINAELRFGQNRIISSLDYGVSNILMKMGSGEPLISSENIGVITLLAMLIAILAAQNQRGKKF